MAKETSPAGEGDGAHQDAAHARGREDTMYNASQYVTDNRIIALDAIGWTRTPAGEEDGGAHHARAGGRIHWSKTMYDNM